MAENVKDINKVSEIKPIKLNNIPKNVKAYGGLQSAASEAAGEVSNFLKKVEKSEGYNKAAFKLAVALSKKTPQKRQDFLMTFDAMRDKLGWDDEDQKDLLQQGAEVVSLEDRRKAEEDEEEETPPSPTEEANPNGEEGRTLHSKPGGGVSEL